MTSTFDLMNVDDPIHDGEPMDVDDPQFYSTPISICTASQKLLQVDRFSSLLASKSTRLTRDRLAELRTRKSPINFVSPWSELGFRNTLLVPPTGALSGIVNLPIEILHLIIDALAPVYGEDEDCTSSAVDDLRNCALTCRAFYERASFNLFSRVEISSETGVIDHGTAVKRLEGLFRVLVSNQRLASQIKVFKLDTYLNSSDAPSVIDNPHEYLPSILSSLSSVTHFVWRNIRSYFCYKDLPTGVVKGLEILTTRPSLVSLGFAGIQDLDLRLLSHCKELKLRQIPELSHQVLSEISPAPPNLFVFHGYGASPITRALLASSPLTFSQLHTLRIWMRDPNEVRIAWAVMQRASETLENLEIDDLAQGDPVIISPVDLCVLVRLRYLRVRCKNLSSFGSIVSLGIVALLNLRKSHPSIRNIKILTDWRTSPSRVTSFQTLLLEQRPDFQAFETLFSTPAIFPNLETVDFDLWVGIKWPDSQHQPSANILIEQLDILRCTWQDLASEPFRMTKEWTGHEPSFSMKLYT